MMESLLSKIQGRIRATCKLFCLSYQNIFEEPEECQPAVQPLEAEPALFGAICALQGALKM